MTTDTFHRCVVAKPPAANNIYAERRDGKGRVKTDEYKKWRALAARSMKEELPRFGSKEPVRVVIGTSMNRQGDLDNIIKPLLDALKVAHVIGDDRYVDRIEAEREPRGVIPDGFVVLTVHPHIVQGGGALPL